MFEYSPASHLDISARCAVFSPYTDLSGTIEWCLFKMIQVLDVYFLAFIYPNIFKVTTINNCMITNMFFKILQKYMEEKR